MNAERVLKDVAEARAYAAFLQSTRGYAVVTLDKVADHCEKLTDRDAHHLRANAALAARIVELESLNKALAGRCAGQSEILSRKAESRQ